MTSEHTGRVVDAHGAPVAGAIIVVTQGTVPFPEIALVSDDEGRFWLRLPAEHFRLQARAGSSIGELEVTGGADGEEIVIAIEP